MIIGLKYWNEGGSAPGSWTNLDVLECHARPFYKTYNRDELLDGTNKAWRRKFYVITIKPGPFSCNNATYRTVIEALLDADYARVKDTRYSYLGDANTVNFVHAGDASFTRDRASLLTEDTVIELLSESAQ